MNSRCLGMEWPCARIDSNRLVSFPITQLGHVTLLSIQNTWWEYLIIISHWQLLLCLIEAKISVIQPGSRIINSRYMCREFNIDQLSDRHCITDNKRQMWGTRYSCTCSVIISSVYSRVNIQTIGFNSWVIQTHIRCDIIVKHSRITFVAHCTMETIWGFSNGC